MIVVNESKHPSEIHKYCGSLWPGLGLRVRAEGGGGGGGGAT